MILNWKASAVDCDLIALIAARAVKLARGLKLPYAQRMAVMDITAVHCNGNPLRLAELLGADEGTFAHDVLGIRQHINRETGQLENFFVPRCSVPEPSVEDGPQLQGAA